MIEPILQYGRQLMARSLSVALASDHPPVEQTYRKAVASAAFTRPDNATPYSAYDVVCDSTSAPTVLEFTGMARAAAGSGRIVKARLMTDLSSFTARTRLHLFHTAPTPIADNSPYTMLWANRDKRIGAIDFPGCATEGSGSNAAATMRPSYEGGYPVPELEYTCASDSTSLFGVLVILAAATPAAQQNFYVQLTADGLT